MHFRSEPNVPTWRRIAATTWKNESEASIYGWIDIDATALNAYLAKLRTESGARVTVTHLVGKALALGFAHSPECNAFVSFGRMLRRPTVDIFFSVAIGDGKSLSGAMVRGADALAVPEIAARLDDEVSRIRGKGDTALQRSQNIMRKIPSALLGTVMRASALAMYDFGIDLTRLGVPFDPFGTAIVTNVGVLGIEQGFAPLMPQGRAAAIVTVGKIRDKVIPVDGKPAVRPVLTLGATFDHRVVDGFHLGKISDVLREVLGDPERAFGSPRTDRDHSSLSVASGSPLPAGAGAGASPP